MLAARMHCTVRLGRSERVCLRGGSISRTHSFDASKVLALLAHARALARADTQAPLLRVSAVQECARLCRVFRHVPRQLADERGDDILVPGARDAREHVHGNQLHVGVIVLQVLDGWRQGAAVPVSDTAHARMRSAQLCAGVRGVRHRRPLACGVAPALTETGQPTGAHRASARSASARHAGLWSRPSARDMTLTLSSAASKRPSQMLSTSKLPARGRTCETAGNEENRRTRAPGDCACPRCRPCGGTGHACVPRSSAYRASVSGACRAHCLPDGAIGALKQTSVVHEPHKDRVILCETFSPAANM